MTRPMNDACYPLVQAYAASGGAEGGAGAEEDLGDHDEL